MNNLGEKEEKRGEETRDAKEGKGDEMLQSYLKTKEETGTKQHELRGIRVRSKDHREKQKKGGRARSSVKKKCQKNTRAI